MNLVSTEQGCSLNSGDTMSVKMLIQVFYDTCFQMEVTHDTSINHALHRATYLSEQSQFLSRKTNFLTLDF